MTNNSYVSDKEPSAKGKNMKKALVLVVLTGLMLTGCSGNQESAKPEAAAAIVSPSAASKVVVPNVLNVTLDKATDQLENLGFVVEVVDAVEGKSIVVEENWQVMT